jgi:hypothetical protein
VIGYQGGFGYTVTARASPPRGAHTSVHIRLRSPPRARPASSRATSPL